MMAGGSGLITLGIGKAGRTTTSYLVVLGLGIGPEREIWQDQPKAGGQWTDQAASGGDWTDQAKAGGTWTDL